MYGPQSWELRRVCLVWVQECMGLNHSIRLELELLRCLLFITEWKSWLRYIREILLYWEDRQRSLLKGQAVPIESLTGLSGASYSWMKCRRNVQSGTPPVNRSGACFYLNKCSITLQLCSIKGIRNTPKDTHRKQLRLLPSTLACRSL